MRGEGFVVGELEVSGLAVGWEEVVWEGFSAPAPMSRSQRARLRPTYSAAIPATIAPLDISIASEVLAAADDARAEIARFDSELSTILADREIAPLSAVLLRTESASSSQIENITAGAKALALAEIGVARYGSNAGLVAQNVDAMRHAVSLADEVTPATILAVHEALMRGQDRALPGEFRREQVWIGGSNISPHDAAFVPPHHSRVETAIDDLCAFIARTDIPLLAHTAIAHAQFETIHPFNDGNGRTGRALVHAMLKQGGATTRTTVPVSAGLLTDTESYFAALTAFRQGDPNPIVRCFADAAFAAVGNGRGLATELSARFETWKDALDVRKSAAVWKVLPLLLSHPAVTSEVIRQHTGLSQPAANNVLKQLRDAGILTTVSGKHRYLVWIAPDVIRALDNFAARARRR